VVCLSVLVAVMVCPARAAMYDLTTEGSAWTINGAVFQQYSDGAGGSGNIDSFVRIQGTEIQQGYNTDYRGTGFPEFDENTSLSFTHSLLLSSVPTVTNGGTSYREFLLDINQNGEPILSLDAVKIAVQASGDLFGYSSIFSSPIYDLDAGGDNWVKLDYSINAGSGAGDMLMYVPDIVFQDGSGGYLGDYVYLYSKFGENSLADDGYEEWAHGVGGPIIPEPATVLLLGLGALALPKKRRA